MTEPNDKKAILYDIDKTREDLGETVDALSQKVDVKARAGAKVADVKETATQKVVDVRDGATAKVADVKDTASAKVEDIKSEARATKAQVAEKAPSASEVKYRVSSVWRDKRVRAAVLAALVPVVFAIIRAKRK